jgi:hypothetical protein
MSKGNIPSTNRRARGSLIARRLFLIATLCAETAPAIGATLARWVELGAGQQIIARAIVDDDSCPRLQIDGVFRATQTRSDPTISMSGVPAARFPVRVCEVDVPPEAKALRLDDKPLPLPPRELARVVIIGDTGCRLQGALEVQDCNDHDAWPYAKIVAHAVAAHPDLVIHVGDYHYRETACPTGRVGCEGSPFGFGWDVWDADFFSPSAPLFAAAPWLMLRGNHEDCDRAGEGWFRFLSAAPVPDRCADLTGFFTSQVGTMGFVMMDGAKATDANRSPEMIQTLRNQFEKVRPTIPDEAWLVTHRPMNAVRSSATLGPDSVENTVQQSAIGDELPSSVRMIVSGHNHFFQALDFAAVRPPQLVVGTGGDKLVPVPREALIGRDVNGARVVDAATRYGYGYMVWDRNGPDWDGTLFDENGISVKRCQLHGRHLKCD